MTITSTGRITLQDISVEAGQSTTYSASLSWVKGITKPALQHTQTELDDYYGFAYFQRTNRSEEHTSELQSH